MVRKEDEEETKKMKKKPVDEEDGKLIKEEEDEEKERLKAKKDSEEESENACKRKKTMKEEEDEESEDEGEEEDEEEKRKKKAKKVKKADGYSENPEQSASESSDAQHSTTPGQVIGQRQNVFVPSSEISGKREQDTPIDKSYSPDLQKSPLWVNLNKQLDAIQDTLGKKVEAMEKSVNDRLKNIKSDIEKIEKFYSQSFYKATAENVGPEGIQKLSVKKQMEEGKLRYSN